MIPRLPADANPIDVTITVNEKLRPYFEIWFQTKKEAGESPEAFALKVLKQQALNFHISANLKVEQNAIEEAKKLAEQAVNDDIQSMVTEVD